MAILQCQLLKIMRYSSSEHSRLWRRGIDGCARLHGVLVLLKVRKFGSDVRIFASQV